MPLDFLKRRNAGETPAQPVAAARGPVTRGPITLPEEIVAQEYQLKLYYAGKTSEGVRMSAGHSCQTPSPCSPPWHARKPARRA